MTRWSIPGIPEVDVREDADVPRHLDGGTRLGPHSTSKPGTHLCCVAGIARYLVTSPMEVRIAVEPGAEPTAVNAYLHGTVLGALIHMRGELPLHATTLIPATGGGAFALAGHAGSGKSTLAYALIQRGWHLLSEDITRITSESAIPLARPGKRSMKLWADSCERFGIDSATLPKVPDHRDKFYVELPGVDSAAPLSRILILGDDRQALGAADAFNAVREQTFRGHYAAALGTTEASFRLIAAVSRRVPISGLTRSPLPHMADRVERLASMAAPAVASSSTLDLQPHGREEW